MKPICLLSSLTTLFLLAPVTIKDNSSSMLEATQSRTIAGDHSCYYTDRSFDKSPDSFEAWIKLPSNLPDNSYGGIIMGSYYSSSGYEHAVNWQVNKKGQLRIFWNQLFKKANAEVDYTFSNFDLRNDKWTHIAVVRNKYEGSFAYYVNGELNEKIYRASSDAVGKMKFNIGVDFLGWLKNTNGDNFLKDPFRGEIKQINVYNGPISQRQIQKDMSSNAVLPNKQLDLIGSWNLDNWEQNRIEDMSTYHNNLTFGNFEKFIDYQETEDFDYTIIGVPDIQITVNYHPETADLDFDWIIESTKTKNTKYVTFVGDLCDSNVNREAQWGVVARNFQKLDYANVSYGFVPGNHDYDDAAGRTRSTAQLNYYLPYETYSKKSYFGGGLYPGKIENYYNVLNIDGIDYLFINLEFGPRDCTLDWANRVCESFPNHRVVVTTHHYLEPSGYINDSTDLYAASAYNIGLGNSSNNGDEVFEKFISKQPNMFMVFSGHTSHDDIVYRRDKGIHGNTIHSILIDAQGSLSATTYFFCDVLSLLKVNEAKKTINIYWYSPLLDKYLNIQNQFEFSFADEFNPAVGSASIKQNERIEKFVNAEIYIPHNLVSDEKEEQTNE